MLIEVTEKPVSMSVKDFLIRKLSVKLLASEHTIESVINHQFQSLLEAMPHCESVELSGFGKFYFNHSRANRKYKCYIEKCRTFYDQMNNPTLSVAKRNLAVNKLNEMIVAVEAIKPKITNESLQDLRRMEEQVISGFPYEAID